MPLMGLAQETVLADHQSVTAVIDHPCLCGAGYFFNDHPVTLVIFIAEAKFVSNGLADGPSAVNGHHSQRLDHKAKLAGNIINIIGAEPAYMRRARCGGKLHFLEHYFS